MSKMFTDMEINGWDGVMYNEHVCMGHRVDPRPMQFMYNRLETELVIVETDKYQMQIVHRIIIQEWDDAKILLEEWI